MQTYTPKMISSFMWALTIIVKIGSLHMSLGMCRLLSVRHKTCSISSLLIKLLSKCRNLYNYTFTATTWKIEFELKTVHKTAGYVLQLALASVTESDLQVRA